MSQKIRLQTDLSSTLEENDVLAAMREFEGYLDISPDDFREIYTKAYAKARRRLFEGITAKDIMSHPVITIAPTMTAKAAVDFFDEHDITGAPVVDEEARILGILSETDIARIVGGTRRPTPMHVLRAILQQTFSPELLAIPVSHIMTKDAVCIAPETTLAAMLERIHSNNISRLPVVDTAHCLVGLVSRTDLLNTLGSLR